MTPIAGCAAHASTVASTKRFALFHETHNALLSRRPVRMLKTSGRVFSCRPTANSATGANAAARRRSYRTRADFAFDPEASRGIQRAVGSLDLHCAGHVRRTPLVAAAASSPDRFDELDDGFAEGAAAEASASFSQGSRVVLAVAMIVAVTAALAAAHFGATPLADLPRPETWALMHPTSFGVRGCALDPGGILRFLDYAGTALFAQAGVVQAGKRGMDFLGCLILGCITAMGGGTFRGFVLGERPVFWAAEPDYLYISLAASAATFFFWPRFEAWWILRGEEVKPNEDARTTTRRTKRAAKLEEVLNWADAISIAAFCVIGANNGLRGANGNPLVAIAAGMFTASFGGIIRDTFCAMPARILHSHQDAYASLSMMGACAYVALSAARVSVAIRIFVPIVLVVAARAAAWTAGWRLPGYRP